ncbi:hypothetical protein GGTG_13397 [Gaeumannomyces tritici R3-111a-1]|uniref:Uncharacterized protein n=1 Tax=Gaeumannomyces tritici (strain R3-111a-1) TaxID=644352 RepID=J3PIR8_GAET3|nr:hypothetical protein GGTG_13397 [Gaeumannomyces tritici R3-111a-1]EJT69000.1 hypothetical protein GGTG_13397 [Gaeumannomyces tritici R3-111a-1]
MLTKMRSLFLLTTYLQGRVKNQVTVRLRQTRPLGSTAANLPRRPPVRLPNSTTPFKAVWARSCLAGQVGNRRASYSSTKPAQDGISLPPIIKNQQRPSTLAIPIHDTSPASIGINTWDGYVQIVAPGTRLPCSRSVMMESKFDHIGEDRMQLCGYLPGPRVRVDLVALWICGIRKEKKEKTKLKATVALREDLSGTFTAHFTRYDGKAAEASVNFCTEEILIKGDGKDALSVQSGNFMVLDGCHKTWTLFFTRVVTLLGGTARLAGRIAVIRTPRAMMLMPVFPALVFLRNGSITAWPAHSGTRNSPSRNREGETAFMLQGISNGNLKARRARIWTRRLCVQPSPRWRGRVLGGHYELNVVLMTAQTCMKHYVRNDEDDWQLWSLP